MSRVWRWEFSGYSPSRLVDLTVGEKAGANEPHTQGLGPVCPPCGALMHSPTPRKKHSPPRIDGWRVLEDFTASDHQYIFFSELFRSRHEQAPKKDARFNTDKLKPDAFSLMIRNGYSEMKRIGIGHRTAEDIASTGIWIKSRGVTYFSCYLTPSDSNDMFRTKLTALEDVIRDCTGYVVLGGYLNAKAAGGSSVRMRDVKR